MRVVLPFRPFPAESELHQRMEAEQFDWMQALRMAVHSVTVTCRCPVHAITDPQTDLPVPSLRYASDEKRLMLWTLDAVRAYIDSSDFDRPTVMLDVDQLVYRPLGSYFRPGVHLGVLVRTNDKYKDNWLLNGVQFWSPKGKAELVAFFAEALRRARKASEASLTWGADTDIVRMMLEPLALGVQERHGLIVEMIESDQVIEEYHKRHEYLMDAGEPPWPNRAVMDFRWRRKPAMPRVYRATFGRGAVA